jgi:HPt (histidine-containing phosphotransfer) domain-containing protein
VEIREAIAGNMPSKLKKAAHTLKGMVAFFEATAAMEATFQLETMGKAENLTGAEEVFAKLAKEIHVLDSALGSVSPPVVAESSEPAIAGVS